MRTLLRHGASVEAIDKTWKTPPLVWALTGWQQSGHPGQYYEVMGQLVDAGATVTPDIREWDKAKADPKMGRRFANETTPACSGYRFAGFP